MQCIRLHLWRRIPHPNTISKESAWAYSRKLIPVHWKNYLVPHGTAMGIKMAVAFANIFMGKVESQILERSAKKTVSWKGYIDDIFSQTGTKTKTKSRNSLNKQYMKYEPPSKYQVHGWSTETTFLDTKVYKGVRFAKELLEGTFMSRRSRKKEREKDANKCSFPGKALIRNTTLGSPSKICQQRWWKPSTTGRRNRQSSQRKVSTICYWMR